jgi:hypothetical protein
MIGEVGFDEDDDSISPNRSIVGEAVRVVIDIDPMSYELSSEDAQNSRKIIDDSTTVVNKLWNYCESSNGQVKLLLPDALHVPFYLPLPRGCKRDLAAEKDRQNRRLECAINKIIAEVSQKSTRALVPDTNATKKVLSIRER